jgi:outer membrane lipoprotein-sorting protein
MFRFRVLALAIAGLAATVLLAKAQNEPDLKAIIRAAIKAHGDEKNLAKYKAAVTKFKGKLEAGGMTLDVTGETSLQRPDKVKDVLNLDIGGNSIEVISVFDGKKLWVSAMGQTKEIDDEKIIKGAKEELENEGAGSLSAYLKEPYELSAIGEVKVKDKAAFGIRISKKGKKDISLFFDKKSNLIVKIEMQSIDAETGNEITQEKFIHSYQEKAGIKVAKRVEILKDGKAFMDIEITDLQMFEKLDDSVFKKP